MCCNGVMLQSVASRRATNKNNPEESWDSSPTLRLCLRENLHLKLKGDDASTELAPKTTCALRVNFLKLSQQLHSRSCDRSFRLVHRIIF